MIGKMYFCKLNILSIIVLVASSEALREGGDRGGEKPVGRRPGHDNLGALVFVLQLCSCSKSSAVGLYIEPLT